MEVCWSTGWSTRGLFWMLFHGFSDFPSKINTEKCKKYANHFLFTAPKPVKQIKNRLKATPIPQPSAGGVLPFLALVEV